MCCEIFWFQRGSQVRRFSAEIEPWIHRPHELNLGARRPSTSKRSARRFARHWLVPSVPGHLGSWWHLGSCGQMGVPFTASWAESVPETLQSVIAAGNLIPKDFLQLTKMFYPRYPLTRWKLVSVDPPILLCCRTSDPTQARSELQRDCCNLRMYGAAMRGFCCTPLVERRWSTLVSERMPLEPKGLSCFFHTFSPWIGNFGAYFSLGRSHKAAAEMVWKWRGCSQECS